MSGGASAFPPGVWVPGKVPPVHRLIRVGHECFIRDAQPSVLWRGRDCLPYGKQSRPRQRTLGWASRIKHSWPTRINLWTGGTLPGTHTPGGKADAPPDMYLDRVGARNQATL